ncbi:MAG TPA: tetratricopeptide repeat protein [Candidatus Mediterraneibacter cottocaccae]|nr:tetratricopeptide repeat protein [Candidatus Mediterraneibacter cottocaccae]
MDYAKKIVYQSNYWYNDGLRKAQIRDMSGAIVSLRHSLQYNRENIAARNLLGLVYYGIGEVPEALVEWIISKNLRPRDNIADYYIRTVQSSANELETMNQAIKKYNQCLGYCRQHGEDLAIIQLKKVVMTHPTLLKAQQLLALLYLHTEQYSRARQVLRTARKLDTANETTLRYLHELTRQRGGRGRKVEKKKKEDAVEYSLGNETIIQPKHSAIREMAGHLAVANIFIGAAIGAAIIWFLVAPAVHQSQSDRMNSQMREYSEQIDALQAQISAQTRTLDEYRAAGDDAAAATAKAQATSASYESLLAVSDQNRSGEYSDATLADTLLTITRDSLGAEGQALYDELASDIYPNACRTNFRSGTNALDAQNYADAVTYLAKVVQMDSTYNGGEALFRLAQAYLGNGDTENATTYFQRVVSEYGDSEYAAEAQTNLDTIAQSAATGAGTDTGTGAGADTGGAAE